MLTVVAVKLIWVPITVLETLVPIVWVAFWLASIAASDCMPCPVKVLNNLISPIVALYPDVSNVWLFPK